MIQFNKADAANDGGETGSETLLLERRKARTPKIPNGLVVSSDREVRQKLAEIAGICGFAAVSASTVAETRVHLRRHRVSIVVCQDHLADGEYNSVVKMVRRVAPGIPVIVLSRRSDWAEYLSATQAGVFDYLAYPPIPGELERVIQYALRACARRHYRSGMGEEPWGSSQ